MRKLIGLISGLLFVSITYSQSLALNSAVPNKVPSSFSYVLRGGAIKANNIENKFYNDRLAGPTDSLSYTGQTTFCSGNNLVLNAKYIPTGATIQWTKDDNAISGATSSSYTVNSSGKYSLTVTDGTNVTQYPSVVVTVNSNPVASYTFNNNNACSGTAIQFNSNVTGGKAPYTYSWDFGDSHTSNVQNPTNQFISLGCNTNDFTTRLTVKDANGCSNTVNQAVTIKQAPNVKIQDEDIFSPFSNCDNSPSPDKQDFTLTVVNASPSASCIASYTINWGDGTIQNNATFPATHTYTKLGAFTFIVTATGKNGCTSTDTHTVANQTNPAGGLGTLGSTTGLCAPADVPFIISNWEKNSPGTKYILDFGDGETKELTHPLNATGTPETITHKYTKTSCPTPTFTATLQAVNACDATPYSAGNIQIRISPSASFTANTSVCVGNQICFNNTTVLGNYGSNCSEATAYAWDFGDGTSGATDENPCHTYNSPGTYTVTLSARNPCGTTTFTKQICVTSKAVPSFSLDNTIGCAPLKISATNKSNTINTCSPTTYQWTVDYASSNCGITSSWVFSNNTNASSTDPVFTFSNPGTYTITLFVSNACGTVKTSQTVTVKQPPVVSITPIQNTCGTATITPTATVTNCGTSALTYLWTFEGGTPTTSTSANPGTVTFSSAGAHKITLAVTNDCGTTTDSKTFTINQIPDLTIPSSQTFCVGDKTPAFNFTSTLPGTTITWTANNISTGLSVLNGSNSIPSFSTTNTSTSAVISIITVSAASNGCSNDQTFSIKVNPRPAAPVTTPITYCQGATASALSATYTSGNKLNWYTVPSGGTSSTTAPVPGTSTTGSTTYYVSQTDPFTTCESPRTSLVVSVNPTPNISSGIATGTNSCGSATGSIKLNGLTALTSYKVFIDGVQQTNQFTTDASGSLVISGLKAGSYNSIFVSLNNCSSNAVGPFTIADPNPPATPTITPVASLCSGSTLTLSVSNPASDVSYQWSGPASFSKSGPSVSISNANTSQAGNYSVTSTINGCTSSAGTVNVVINQTPATPVASNNSPICSNNTVTLKASTSTPGSISYAWTGPNNFTSALQNPTISNVTTAATGVYTVTATLGACTSTSATTSVMVNPTPVINSGTPADPSNCSSATGSITLKGLTANTTYTVNYKKNGATQPAVSFTADNNGELIIKSLTAGSYDNITVSLTGCTSNSVGPFVLKDPTPPAVPVIAAVDPICSGNTLNFSASSATAGVAYQWSGPNNYSQTTATPSISNIKVSDAGDYSVTATLNGCTSAAATVKVVVNQTPATPTVRNNGPVCSGGTINLTASTSTPGSISYAWTGPNSFTSPVQNPSIPNATIAAAGDYKVTATLGSCISAPGSTTVAINPTPVITGSSSKGPATCSGTDGTITLNGLVATNTYTVNYTKDGVAQTAVTLTADANGDITIKNLRSGTYDNVRVTLNGCPSAPAGPFVLTDPTPPTAPTVSSNTPVCTGSDIKLTANTTSTGTITYAWTGPNNFTSPLQNPVVPGTSLTEGDYKVTVTINGCSSSATTTVKVNPKPAPPVVKQPLYYCLNDSPTPLTATSDAGNSLTWYDNQQLNNGSATAPTPSAATAGDMNYYVTQTNSFGCISDPSNILVTVYPAISGNSIGTDETICSGNTPKALTETAVLAGGTKSYTYQWQMSTDGTAWTNLSGATNATYAPGALFSTTWFRRAVFSGPCVNNFSNPVKITVQGTITNFEISESQTICANTAPQMLNGLNPAGGNNSYDYQWESSTNNSTWNIIPNEISQNYQPPVLTSDIRYRRLVKSGSCSVYSSPVTITVNQIPTVAKINDGIYCNNTSLPATTFSGTPSDHVSYSWTNDNPVFGIPASGTDNIPPTKLTNTSAPGKPVTATISVTPTYTQNNVGCKGPLMSYTITVLPTVSIKPINDTVVCTGSAIPSITPEHDADPAKGTVTYNITVSGQGIPITSRTGASTIPGYTTSNTGNTDMVSTITVTPVYTFKGTTCNGTPITYTVTVKPATPNADAGPDQTLCADLAYTMKAVGTAGTNGTWTQTGGIPVTIADPSSPTTKISDLAPGNQYTFEWTVKGFASCPSTKDQVTITVTKDLVNKIDNIEQTICSGKQVTVQGEQPTGGSGTYTYQWQESLDNGNTWKDISGQTGASLTYTPAQPVWVKRIVYAAPCTKESEKTHIIVQPPVTNNVISKDQSICINTAALPLRGNTPSGAGGSFLYQWQSSSDGITWTDIPGATAENYDPGILTQTTKFRRNAGSSLCSGPQSNNSNVVTITVNPNAVAQFISSKDISCAPFLINNSVITLQPDNQRNSGYQWYVDGNLKGSGTTFPSYTITNSGDSITVKLVAISKYGCRNDSMEHKFYTVVLPKPSFTVTPDEGCGPLTVSFKNTTPDADKFQFIWDLGNGKTVKAQEPGTITYLSNPTYGDTTYTVQLKAFSTCDTITISQQILVKSKPKALFTPSATTGCSPMKVVFSNTSLGKSNSYIWDFGDGTKVPAATADTISHVFITGVRDTFHVQLIAMNACGNDTMTYAVVVAPNNIRLDFAINGTEQSGCTPHTVHFINNTKGATSFTWNFGDNTVTHTTKNIDTLTHSYLTPGTYTVTLFATNGCSDTTTTETVTVYPTPHAAFTANQYTACLGDQIRLTNASTDANSYLWQFGDGAVSTLENPVHAFKAPGVYTVTLSTIRVNDPGSTCTDTARVQVTVVSSMPGQFDVSDSVSNCAPFTVTFTNRNTPSVTAIWDLGDGTTATGDIVNHTYTKGGNYIVKLTVTVPGGCTYITTKTIRVLGPVGTFNYTGGYVCNNNTLYLQAQANNTDTYVFDFGDGKTLTTTSNTATHTYANGGTYLPSVILKNKSGCQVVLTGIDSVKADKVHADFTAKQQVYCGTTTVQFSTQSLVFFGHASIQWDLGDGTTASGSIVIHDYHTSGDYIITQIVTGISGCSDTSIKKVHVQVNSQPKAAIVADASTCVNYQVSLKGDIQSADAIGLLQWTVSNGMSSTSNPFNATFHQSGDYTVRLVVGTVNGCFDTTQHNIHVNPSPAVTTTPDATICLGNSTQMKVTGSADVVSYSWNPTKGLNCVTCTAPTAAPAITTSYVAQGTNSFGCSAWDTTVVTVIQPLHMQVSPNDSICIGQSTNLLASGATAYSWSPAEGLNRTDIQNPTATPTVTTRYRVVGYDGFNCFTDTAFVTVAIGKYPTVNLGPDLTLATGIQQQLQSVVTNGPIRNWLWTPSTNLSCSNCALPVAIVKNDISYVVKVTTAYGCSATDTINIKAFCKDAQTFIPNAFTPDGDGINDILMVRAQGVVMVKSFRVFNRWGEVVFERSSFRPNDQAFGWDGKIHGVVGGPDVYVYTAEVVCENGATFTYKGNVSIVK